MEYNDSVYGKQEIKEPVILELMKTKAMQRTKGINQYGTYILRTKVPVTRWDHSIGVFLILRKFNASLEEQIAGLIHDISHTVLSHCLDFYFNSHTTHEAHEKYHEDIIKKSQIPSILRKHNMDLEFILDMNNFKLLEREMPDLCADRIDYSLRDMITLEQLTKDRSNTIRNNLKIHNKEFIFTNIKSAKILSMKYIKMNEIWWGNPFQTAIFQLTAELIEVGINNNIINEKDFFGIDKQFIDKLTSSKNPEITSKINQLRKFEVVEDKNNYDYHLKTKPRHIDPKVLINSSTKRLSELDTEFKERLDNYLKKMKEGFYIRVIN
jgi:HD superfamily phosphohydrolase